MNFKIEDLKVDLGVTPLENMFLNTYVQMADGDALKVYLLIYKDIYNQGEVDSSKIKKQLNFSDDKFNEAIEFWKNMGVFREKRTTQGESYIEIVSLRQMYFGDNNKADKNEASFDKQGRKTIMFENVERIIDRNLTPADITRIQETLADYGQEPELVTEAFRQAKAYGNVDVKYVMGFLKSWRDQGIMSLNDLKIHEQRQSLIRSKGPRQYKKGNKKLSSAPSTGKSYAEQKRAERIKKMLEEGGNES